MNKWILLGIILIGCGQKEQSNQLIDVQGHRGARGLAPENSIPAFLLATKLGVTTLELDLSVSKDNQLVVSHEPFFSLDFCLDMNGSRIAEDTLINMYELTYDEISRFDCGSIGHPRFPDQKKMTVSKPLLGDVVDQVEEMVKKEKLSPVRYNIELKTTRKTDSVFHPTPEMFSDLVYNFLLEKKMLNRITIQSFDFRTLQYFNQQYPEVELVLLIENELTWQTNIDSLGFMPEVYSPYYQLLSQEKVTEIKNIGMKVIPWTVNEMDDINKVLSWNVDGIISDYPDRVLNAIK